MKSNLLIIGKKSFIGNNLFKFSRNKRFTRIIDFRKFMSLSKKKLSSFDIIINCTSNQNYVKKKYIKKNDFDIKIANKIEDLEINYIFISTRKVYRNGFNLKENSKIIPKDNYSKNKLISEKKLFEILKDKLLILRLSNVIGTRKKNLRRLHKTFIDNYFELIRKGKIIKINREYKDFLSIRQLTRILDKVIEKKLTGTYNVSLSKKIYLKEIISWLNCYNLFKYKYINLNKNFNDDSFTLNNKKLLKEIKIKLYKKDLEKECKLISKNFFKKI